MPLDSVVIIQLDIAWEGKSDNYEKVRALVGANPPAAGAIMVLPEMFSTGFSMNVELTRQGADKRDEAFLSSLAAEHRVTVVGGVVSAGPNGLARNEAVAFSPE